MDKFRAIKLFVRLADLGSFTRVAEENLTTKSLVSKEISRLEQLIDTRLLHRSTRHLQLTPAGEGYLQHCREILDRVEDSENYVQSLQGSPKGKLRINAPMTLGIIELSQALVQFSRRFPDIELDIHLDDEPLDLIAKGFDLGFRASSQLLDSGYIGKPLTQFRYHICASKDYLAAHAPIERAAQLADHNCFVYSYFQGRNVWPIEDGVSVGGNLRVNNTIFMMEAIKQGLGIGFIPEFVCKEALRQGEVVEILNQIARPYLTLYALYPARRYTAPALLECIIFLENWFRQQR